MLLNMNWWSSSKFTLFHGLNLKFDSRFSKIWREPDWTRLRQHYGGGKEGRKIFAKFPTWGKLRMDVGAMQRHCEGHSSCWVKVGSWGWCQVFVSVWLRSDEPTRNMRKSNSVWSEGDFLGLITSPIYRTHSYIRTPESSLRGISIIWINFSKFCLRFTIIWIKIADFRKNLTLLIQIDPADFWRLVWQSR